MYLGNVNKKKKIVKSYSLYNIENNEINISEKKNKTKKLKKHLSSRQILNNKFYKLFKNTNSQKQKINYLFSNVIDKDNFNFKLEDENDIYLKKTFNIQNGNKKHLQFCKLENKKKETKLNSIKLFYQQMKILQKNAKEEFLEQEKRKKELVKIKKNKEMRLAKTNEKVKIKQNKKNIFNEKTEDLENCEEKLKRKRYILMIRFNNLMKRIKKAK